MANRPYILIAERGEDGRPNGLYKVLDPTTYDPLTLGLSLEEAQSFCTSTEHFTCKEQSQ